MDVDDSRQPQLTALYENRFSQVIDTKLANYNDPHDLVAAISSKAQKVLVHRINGQLAFSVDRKDEDCTVSALKWKPDGSLLGVGWSDGTCVIYSGEDGKLLSQTSLQSPEEHVDASSDNQVAEGKGICCIGWTSYDPDLARPARLSKATGLELTTDDWPNLSNGDLKSARNGEAKNGTGLAALAKSIAMIDATKPLPLLSALPTHALRFRRDEQKFTTQAGLNVLLDVDGQAPDSMSTLMISATSGANSVYLHDTVRIGDFDLHPTTQAFHASHPQSPTQSILSTPADQQDGRLLLNQIDLPLNTLGGSLLQVVATNAKRMQNLADYIAFTVRCIQSDFETNLQLPNRLINNISEELTEKQEGSLVTSLYHLAMTGTFTPTTLEWLADTVKESTHKRWDKAVNDMYTHIRTHLFVHLIPALDRLAIAVNAIRGHALFHEHTDRFVPSEPFTTLMDDIDSVRLLGQQLLLIIMTEHKQFKAFSKWMRVMIDIGVAGPGSKAASEIEEREVPNVDEGLVLAYINDTLNESRLALHLKPRSPNTDITSKPDRTKVVEALRRLQSYKTTGEPEDAASLNLHVLLGRLEARTREAISPISKWQSGMLLEPSSVPLDSHTIPNLGSNASVLDLKVLPMESSAGADGTATDILMTSRMAAGNDSQLSLYRCKRSPGSVSEITSATCTLHGVRLIHAIILSNSTCLALVEHGEEGGSMLLLCDLPPNSGHSSQYSTIHTFTKETGFKPDHFVVGGRQGKMVCVVFGAEGREWKVLDLKHSFEEDPTGG